MASLLAQAIRVSGFGRAYVVPGQRVLPLIQQLGGAQDVEVILTRHEQGAAFMADSDARISGCGLVVTTSGPGAINALTGAATAYTDSVAVMIITAQAATNEFGRQGIQEGTGQGRNPDVVQMYEATTKASRRPMMASQVLPTFYELLDLARHGRPGPVHLDLPSDLLLEDAEWIEPLGDSFPSNGESPSLQKVQDLASEIAERLRVAERPVIAVGNGVAASSVATLYDLAVHLGVPIVNSFIAKRLWDQTAPWVVGTIGSFGMRAANRLFFEESDYILSIGMSFNALSTSGWLEPDADRIDRVDLDPRQLQVRSEAFYSHSYESRIFVDALKVAADNQPSLDRDLPAKNLDREDEVPKKSGLLHPAEVMKVLNEFVHDSVTFIADVGQNTYWGERYLYTRGDGRFLINGALGSMGHGVAGAVGAFEAVRNRGTEERVICICGDGGFMMGALEVSTAAARKAGIVWVVLNNGTLATQRAWFERNDLPPIATELPPIDLGQLARSLGAEAYSVGSVADLRSTLVESLRSGLPTVIDVATDGEYAPAVYVKDE